MSSATRSGYTVVFHMRGFLAPHIARRQFVLAHLDVVADGRRYLGSLDLPGVSDEDRLKAYESPMEVDNAAGGEVDGSLVPFARVLTRSQALDFLNNQPTDGRADVISLVVPKPPTKCVLRVRAGYRSEQQEIPFRITSG